VPRYESALQRWPSNDKALRGLAAALGALGRNAEAMAVLQRALDLRPDRPAAWALMGKLASASGDSQAAIGYLELALRIDPTLLLARRDLFSIYRERGETDRAIEQLRQILRLAPTDFFALTQLAWIHATSGDPAYRDGPRALMLAGQACGGFDELPPICLDTMAAALAENQRYAEAIELARRAIPVGDHGKAAELAMRLQLYESRQPYRERQP